MFRSYLREEEGKKERKKEFRKQEDQTRELRIEKLETII